MLIGECPIKLPHIFSFRINVLCRKKWITPISKQGDLDAPKVRTIPTFSWLSMMAGATAIAIGATMAVGVTAGSGGIAVRIVGAGAAGRIAAACGGMAAEVATTGIEHDLGWPSSEGQPRTKS